MAQKRDPEVSPTPAEHPLIAVGALLRKQVNAITRAWHALPTAPMNSNADNDMAKAIGEILSSLNRLDMLLAGVVPHATQEKDENVTNDALSRVERERLSETAGTTAEISTGNE